MLNVTALFNRTRQEVLSDTPLGLEIQRRMLAAFVHSLQFLAYRQLREERRILHSWFVPYDQLLGSNGISPDTFCTLVVRLIRCVGGGSLSGVHAPMNDPQRTDTRSCFYLQPCAGEPAETRLGCEGATTYWVFFCFHRAKAVMARAEAADALPLPLKRHGLRRAEAPFCHLNLGPVAVADRVAVDRTFTAQIPVVDLDSGRGKVDKDWV
jgi:hypothetical protein